MSLPSMMISYCVPTRLCISASFCRTGGCSPTLDAPMDSSGVRSSPVTSSSPRKTCWDPSSIYFTRTSAPSSMDAIPSGSSGLTPLRIAYSAIARYIAPVSRYRIPRRFARDFAAVLFPAPAGPSIAILILSFTVQYSFPPARLSTRQSAD